MTNNDVGAVFTGKPENRKTGKPENRKTGKPENRKTGKPENRKTGKPENRNVIRFAGFPALSIFPKPFPVMN
ncbi:hypothetical protein [Sinisalibacter aestuarii]|uniref:hypothetical protein n=1 Tax=Sinisalibacter aestuarii TaxID=2949426 RepID=UPI002493585C|nr:hypothetical protein [Sinisalibacter aestuarii]